MSASDQAAGMDPELVILARGGDHEAFTALVEPSRLDQERNLIDADIRHYPAIAPPRPVAALPFAAAGAAGLESCAKKFFAKAHSTERPPLSGAKPFLDTFLAEGA